MSVGGQVLDEPVKAPSWLGIRPAGARNGMLRDLSGVPAQNRLSDRL